MSLMVYAILVTVVVFSGWGLWVPPAAVSHVFLLLFISQQMIVHHQRAVQLGPARCWARHKPVYGAVGQEYSARADDRAVTAGRRTYCVT
jgi:hypothetical protein